MFVRVKSTPNSPRQSVRTGDKIKLRTCLWTQSLLDGALDVLFDALSVTDTHCRTNQT